MSLNRKVSTCAVLIGIFSCLFAAIWCPEESVKWVFSAIYLSAVSRWFGLTFKKEKVKGTYLKPPYKELNYLNLRKK